MIANEAARNGGGLFINDTDLFMDDGTSCLILGNIADADDDGTGIGGGIYHSGVSDLNMPAARVCLNNPDDVAGG